MSRSGRRAPVALLVMVVSAVAVPSAGAVSAAAIAPVAQVAEVAQVAQVAQGPAPEDPCLTKDGQTVSTSVNGPGPVGRCDPPAGFRVLDTAIWVWTIGVFVALVVGLAWTGRRRADRVRPDRGIDDPV